MSLRKKLRQLGHILGLTKEFEIETSPILSSDATVVEARETHLPDGFHNAFLRKDKYYLRFHPDLEEGTPIEFRTLSDTKFRECCPVGNRVHVHYRRIYKVTKDYVKPDFDKKQPVKKEITGYWIDEVKQTE